MDLATATFVAAITAAGISLVNVAISYRLTRREHREEWQRNEERPIVARVLTLSEDARAQWQEAWTARKKLSEVGGVPERLRSPEQAIEYVKVRDEAVERWEAGSELYSKLRIEVAQLDLVAGHPVRVVAAKLAEAHGDLQKWARPWSPSKFYGGHEVVGEIPAPLLVIFGNRVDEITELHEELVDKTRADLGLGGQ